MVFFLQNFLRLVFFARHRNVVYEQTTVLTTSVRRLDARTGSEIDFFETQDRRRLMQDCSSGYSIFFENWWNNTSALPIDPVENITYVEETPGENATGFGGIIIAPEAMVSLGGSGDPINASFSYNLEVFECDESNQPFVKTSAYSQGDLFRICIKPDADARSDGLYMRRLDNIYYTRQDIPGLIQFAIEGGLEDFYGMSKIYCERGDEVCRVDTIIRAEFFSSPGMVNVVGIASMQLGSSSSRRNIKVNIDRNLQNIGAPDDKGKFSLLFPVGTFAQSLRKRQESSGVSTVQYLLLVLLSFLFVTVLIYLFWIRLYRKAHTLDDEEDELVWKSRKKKNRSSKRNMSSTVKDCSERSNSSRISVRFADGDEVDGDDDDDNDNVSDDDDEDENFDDDREEDSQYSDQHDV
jgi:hypothetical protein